MGGTQKQSVNKSNYANYLACIHPHLQTAKLVESNDGFLLESKTLVQPFLQLDPWLDRKETFEDHIYSKYLFLPVKTAIEPRLCSYQETVVFYYEPFIFSLDHEIQMRTNSERGFDETELWYLLYTGVSALSEFEKINERVGKICPRNILMNEKGHIRFVNRYSWPGQPDYYVPQNQREREYMAPEEFGEHSLSKRKSDTFNLGMVLLECITLEPISEIYSGGTFNANEFGLHIQYLHPGREERYSNTLKQTIKRMLDLSQ